MEQTVTPLTMRKKEVVGVAWFHNPAQTICLLIMINEVGEVKSYTKAFSYVETFVTTDLDRIDSTLETGAKFPIQAAMLVMEQLNGWLTRIPEPKLLDTFKAIIPHGTTESTEAGG
jgi:hypothetical protein